jgi:hypothetical protein
MTRLEVIDSAIKIGLGALIGLVSSVAISFLTARHERKKEVRGRRLNAIEKSAVDFETQTAVFLRLYSSYGTLLIMFNEGDEAIPSSMEKNLAEAKLARSNVLKERMQTVWNVINNEVGPALLELHRIEAVLVTVGANDASKRVGEYRTAASDLQSAVVDYRYLPEKLPTHGAFSAIMEKAAVARGSFYAQIQKDFRNS